jgi:hypothetical protein
LVATPNYSYEKRQRELAKKRKQEEKRKKKTEHRPDDPPSPGSPVQPGVSDTPPPSGGNTD